MAIERPFYLIVVVWGERFRNYFLDYCVPSLLAPGNLPALAPERHSKFLIATRPDDWAAMRSAPIFPLLAQYVEPVFIEIPPCPPDRSGCQHMGIGHKLACDMAYRDKAYGAVLTPDCMLTDGSFARLQELAQSGTELVLVPALRLGEEPLFEHLRIVRDGGAVTIAARDMMRAAVNSFHSHTLSCEWGGSYYPHVPHCAWWRVPGEDGIVLHCMSWAPLLIDYAVFADHDTTTMDQWTIDGDYIYRNIDHLRKIHVVVDSDEMFIASWGPMAERAVRRLPVLRLPLIGRLIWLAQFKHHFHSAIFDPFRRSLFYRSVRWHSRPVNASWSRAEERAARAIDRIVPENGKGSLATVAAGWLFLIWPRAWSAVALLILMLRAARGDVNARDTVIRCIKGKLTRRSTDVLVDAGGE
jgi:hypothetical protein